MIRRTASLRFEGYQELIRYDGFFLADVVGLGKTVIATMIAKKFLIESGKNNKVC